MTGWNDFVFDRGYRLTPLPEVRAYIAQYHHLPGIAPEAEIVKKGLDLGQANKTLTKKVEELTLYAIAQDRRLAAQKDAAIALQQQVSGLAAELKEVRALLAVRNGKRRLNRNPH